MKHRKRQELAAGFFAIVCLSAGLGIVLWLGGGNLWLKKSQAVWFYAEQSRGRQSLLVGSPVIRGDVQVGKITSMTLDPEGNRVLFGVAIYNDQTRVYRDAEARVAAPLVGKDVALAILVCGHEDKGLADEGHPIRIKTGALEAITGEFDLTNHNSILYKLHAIADSLGDAAGHVHGVAELVQATLGEIAPRLAHTFKTLDETTAEAAPALARTVKTVDAIVADAQPKIANTLTKVSGAADRVDEFARKDLAGFLAQLHEANTKVLKTLENLEGASGDVRQIVSVNRTSINEIVDNMATMSASLKATANEVRRNPWRLMYTPTKDEREKDSLLQATRAFSAGAAELDQALAKLKSVDPAVADAQTVQGVRDHLTKSFARFREVEDLLWKQLNSGDDRKK
ncbi:MAG: MlaD family protein [Planctomycetota bacterium]|nr:MlaD family protein [Planctomycetota bacterium]